MVKEMHGLFGECSIGILLKLEKGTPSPFVMLLLNFDKNKDA